MQTKRSPVAEGNSYLAGLPVLVLEPGAIRWWLGAWCTTQTGQDFAVSVAVSNPGQDVADQLAASPAGSLVMPPARSVFSHFPETFCAFSGLQHPFDFAGTGQGLLHCPLRDDTGMYHQYLLTGRPVGQWLALQPAQQFQPVRCLQNGIDFGIRRLTVRVLVIFSQQVQVMVAQCHDETVTQAIQQTENLQRVATAIDQVAGAPQSVAGGVEVDFFQQSLQGVVAPLDVTDQESGHSKSVQ